MMLCVISYWVLSGAKRRQIQQLRCCVLPAKLLKRRDVYLKLTRHNGRAGSHGTYNPKHNDRSFNLANSEHIDPERAKGNIYWDCFHGFRSALAPQDPDDLAATFSDVERQFYESRYTTFIEGQNERNAKIRHTERNRSIPDLLSSRKTCPEETIYQLGTLDEHASAEDLLNIVTEFIDEFKAKFGEHVHVLDWALHLDESTPHIHERHVFDCENRYGEIAPQQEKALEALGFELPDPDKLLSRRNNRKITFDAACRKMLFEIAKRHGLELEEEAEYGNRKYLEKQDFIFAKQKEQLAAQQNRLDELTLKVNDMETLIDEVAAAAYDKAVEVVTDVVRTETRKEDMRMIEDTKKWVLSPERKAPQATREYAAHRLMYILRRMEKYGLYSEKRVSAAIRIVANENHYHPIRDYLNELKWDGTARISRALHRFLGAAEDELTTEALKIFLLGAIKRVFHPGCKFEMMLCLVGGQGAGKSSFFRLLAIKDEWFSDDLRRLDDDNVFRKLQGHWIMEMSEMIATANAKSIEEIKSFLSKQKETYKIPYETHPADRLRQCVFAGTTNRQDFLPRDRTGNRRFIPIPVDATQAEVHILDNEAESRAYIDQLWAEAMTIYNSGDYKLTFSPAMQEALQICQKDFMQEDTQAGMIYAFLEDYTGDRVCSKQLYAEALGNLNLPAEWETRAICEIMTAGIVNGEIKGWTAHKAAKRYPKYGVQKGWERVTAAKVEADGFVELTDEEAQQMGFPF